MTAPLTDTHRRASLRGRESVARWRIEGASWVGWLYGAAGGVGAIGGLVGGTGESVAAGALGAAAYGGLAYGVHRMRRGGRVAACAVVGTLPLLKALSGTLATWTIWDGIIVLVLANGAWGTFQLAAVRREAADVPPAPEPARRFGRAFG